MHTAQQCKVAVSVLVYLMVDFAYAVIRFVEKDLLHQAGANRN